MSRLDVILNPESEDERSVRQDRLTSPGASLPSSSSSPAATTQPVGNYAYKVSDVHEHDPHPNCPNELNCLPDTEDRPQHTLPVILRCAILGSQKKRLTIREIYSAMEEKYPYYRTAGQTWKQSVRHHLSLNRLFERKQRPDGDPGFGSYWTVNLDAPPGTKRPRKRGRTNREPLQDGDNPRKRGRPRKVDTFPPLQPVYHMDERDGHDGYDEYSPASALERLYADRRPPRNPPMMYSFNEAVDVVEFLPLRRVPEIPLPRLRAVREEDYESDEETQLLEPRYPTPSFSSSAQSQGTPNPGTPPHRGSFTEAHTIDRLRMELNFIRQQSSTALEEAQAETSRVRLTLYATERMLREEERMRRREEMLRRDEERRRREVERALYDLKMKLGPSHEHSWVS